jgi:hypothetical protein
MEVWLALWEHEEEEEGQGKEENCAIAEPVTFTNHDIVLQGHNEGVVKNGSIENAGF